MRQFQFGLLTLLLLACACSLPGGAGSEAGVASSPLPEEATSPPRGKARLPEHLHGLEQRLLHLHNRDRSQLALPALTWDSQLAAGAASYGPTLEATGRLIHSPGSVRPGQGENLWMGTRDRYGLESMFHGWSGERRLFRTGVFPRVSTSGRWREVAHYTQIIWPDTKRVGCAVHRGINWDYLICRYAPAGNVIGQRLP